MPFSFGGDPNTMTLDDLLAQLGIGQGQGVQAPPVPPDVQGGIATLNLPQAAPPVASAPPMRSMMLGGQGAQTAIQDPGDEDPIRRLLAGLSPSLGGATGGVSTSQPDPSAFPPGFMQSLRFAGAGSTTGSGGGSPNVAPATGAQDQAQNASPATNLPPPPQSVMYGKRGELGDVLDHIFLGGAISRFRDSERAHALANFETQRNSAILGSLSPAQQIAFLTNAPELGKAFASQSEATNLDGGVSRLIPGLGGAPPQMITAPKLGIDNGHLITQTADGSVGTGYTGPSYLANGLDQRGGGQVPLASSPVVPNGSQLHNTITAGNTLPSAGGAWFGAAPPATAPASGPIGAMLRGLPKPGASSPADALASIPAAQPDPTAILQSIKNGTSQAAVARGLTSRWTANGVSPTDQSTLLATARIESSMNPKVGNNGSSTGVFQFHPATFQALGGTDINDPGQQADAAVALLQQNRAILTRALGRAPTPAELYLAHQQGARGATAILTADPGANAVQTLMDAGVYRSATRARRAITGNFGTADMSAGQFAGVWQGKFDRASRGVARLGGGDAGATSNDSSLAAQGTTQGTGGGAPGGQPGGFFGASDTALGQARTPHLLQQGDPRLKQFAPGQAVEEDAAGNLKPLEGTGFTPTTLNSIYERNTKDLAPYTDAVPLIRAARQASAGQSGASDISLAESAARLFNPKASVRQGSLKMFFDDTQGIPDIITGALAQLKPGDGNARFTPATRGAIMQMVEQRASILRQSAQPIIQAQQQFAARNNINPGDILPPIEEAGPPPRASGQVVTLNPQNPNADFARLPKGSQYRGPDGVVRTK